MIEIEFFKKCRNKEDGITFLELEIEKNKYGHKDFVFSLVIFNYTIFFFNWYNPKEVENE